MTKNGYSTCFLSFVNGIHFLLRELCIVTEKQFKMKNSETKTKNTPFDARKVKAGWYLLAGILTIAAANMTFSLDIAGWISIVPFLIYLHLTKGWKSRVLFFLALTAAWSVVVLKIITAPIPVLFALLYSVPIALVHLPAYLLWDRFKNHRWSLLLFPATMVIAEWIQYTFTPLGSWGAAAYTQSHSTVIMQVVSVFGMAGLGFIIYWVNVSVAEIIITRKTRLLSFQLPLAVLAVVLIFGAVRSEKSGAKGKDTITVSAVGTDSDVSGLPLPSKESNEKVITALFNRTTKAAKMGAKLVVWNEGAFFMEPEYEEQWLDSIQKLAAGQNITLVASYVLLVSENPFRYENKYHFILPNGQIAYTYLKHEPVPGEPAIKGKSGFRVLEVAGAKTGGAICYDYDFPYIARAYGKLKADIIALPSSDWRGIDPLHTRMAAFRAVEQGHSVLRSTRFGLSAAITPYGKMTSQMSAFDNNDKIMMGHLPSKGITTVYSIIGDLFVYLCISFILLFLFFVCPFFYPRRTTKAAY